MQALIVGGGIIGLSTAWYLQEAGWQVTVLEKGDLTDNCSFGNMGYLSPSHFVPLAAPGVLGQGLFWLFNKKSPFYVRPIPSLSLVDWGLKFARAATPGHVQRSARPMLDLLFLSKKLLQEWAAAGDMKFGLTEKGCLMLYQTEKYEKGELAMAEKAAQLGLRVEVLGREQVQTIEPNMQADVRGGVLYQDDAHINPNALMQQLPALLESRGVQIIRNAQVTGFERRQGKITAVHYQTPTQNSRLRTGSGGHAKLETQNSITILAAGAWSPQLARMAGEYLPLMPGKGYSMTIENPERTLNHPCILVEAKVALTPWQKRLRIGSTMEIGPVNDRILRPRVQGILDAVSRFFPGLMQDPGVLNLAEQVRSGQELREKVWYGFRPVSADGLPYIGFARKSQNLIMATGHAMLGISMAAGTGKVVAELAEGKKTSVAVEAFDPNRFRV